MDRTLSQIIYSVYDFFVGTLQIFYSNSKTFFIQFYNAFKELIFGIFDGFFNTPLSTLLPFLIFSAFVIFIISRSSIYYQDSFKVRFKNKFLRFLYIFAVIFLIILVFYTWIIFN